MRAILQLLRPSHWIKNGIIAAPLFFSLEINIQNILLVALTIVGFCVLSSAIYCLNDALDYENDRHHPIKRQRPVARGAIRPWQALLIAAAAAVMSLGLLNTVSNQVFLTGLAYGLLNVGYSVLLKQFAIIDAMIIALGFVLRVIAGAYAIHVPRSHWIILCTFFVMLFVAFGKRKHEMTLAKGELSAHRRSAAEYTEGFINQMLSVTAGLTVVFYSLYTIDPQTVSRVGTERLIYTTPFVVFGTFRYFYLLYNKDDGGDPVKIFLSDRALFWCAFLWACSVTVIYFLHGPIKFG